MKRPVRTAALLTLAFTFGALWIAFVTVGGEEPVPQWSPLGLPPIVAILLLMAALFLAGLLAMSAAGGAAARGSPPRPAVVPTAIAAVLIVGTVPGLVSSLQAVLWGGPAWDWPQPPWWPAAAAHWAAQRWGASSGARWGWSSASPASPPSGWISS